MCPSDGLGRHVCRRVRAGRAFVLVLALGCGTGLTATTAIGQGSGSPMVIGGNVQKRANGVLALMGYSVVPDLAGSSLSIKNASTDNPGVLATQFGGGSLLGDSFPAYVEGFLGYSRYDPTFVATAGQQQRLVPTKWNTFAGTGGLGWGIRLIGDLRLIPIFNFSLGHVASDSAIAGTLITSTAAC